MAIIFGTPIATTANANATNQQRIQEFQAARGRQQQLLRDMEAEQLRQENLSKQLEGSLPYMSPEQTGRMNRDLDYRSDFYSLGVTFYEMLTGRWPFQADSVLEWVHNHIGRSPVPPRELNDDIPEALSDIVLKLMSKNAEDRYQSTYGLLTDLRNCREQLDRDGVIEAFESLAVRSTPGPLAHIFLTQVRHLEAQ